MMCPSNRAVATERLEEKLSAVGTLDANEAVDINRRSTPSWPSSIHGSSADQEGRSPDQFDDASGARSICKPRPELDNAKVRAERSEKLSSPIRFAAG